DTSQYSLAESQNRRERARAIAASAIISETPVRRWTQRFDQIFLHPALGLLILLGLMFLMFQAVYAWSEAPMGLIEDGFAAAQSWVGANMAEGFFQSLIIEGMLGGVGAVLVFLPQIIILFL